MAFAENVFNTIILNVPQRIKELSFLISDIVGGYLFINSTGKMELDRAILIPTVPVTNSGCLTFYYHIHGEAVGELSVISTGTPQPLLTINGNHGNRWRLAQAEIQRGQVRNYMAGMLKTILKIYSLFIYFCFFLTYFGMYTDVRMNVFLNKNINN